MPGVRGKNEILVMGKGDIFRTVKITPYAVAFLNWVCSRRTGYVFNSERGQRHEPQNINAILKGVGLKTNLTFLHPHLLRHTYASILVWCGCDIAFVRDQLGHANIATTDIYTNVLTDRLGENPPEIVVKFLKAINPLHPENINII